MYIQMACAYAFEIVFTTTKDLKDVARAAFPLFADGSDGVTIAKFLLGCVL